MLFPDLENHRSNDSIIAVGGDLSTTTLIDAYSKGIFPWYNEGEPILWHSPNPRMIIDANSLHVSNSLKKVINKKKFDIRVNTDFTKIINHCKNIRRQKQDGTWINDDMVSAYIELHNCGYAQSIGAYEDNKLVGGLYGVALGKVFFGESMFSLVSNASKVALVSLVNCGKYQLIDCQVANKHLISLGAFNVERSYFIQQIKKLIR